MAPLAPVTVAPAAGSASLLALEAFERLSSSSPGALPYSILREWTGDFAEVGPADGPFGRIGQGAFGDVFKGLAVPPAATATAGIRAVRLAVKRMDTKVFQLNDAGGSRDAFTASFRREINVLSRFHNPHIVRLLGFSEPCLERKEPPCLVYELLALGSLASQLRDSAKAELMPWQIRLDILVQIAMAINYLHCHNPGYPAFHRDIKADNIALSEDYTAKLIDCGYETLTTSIVILTLTLTLTLSAMCHSLSKYIAEDGQGRSIHSATGGRY